MPMKTNLKTFTSNNNIWSKKIKEKIVLKTFIIIIINNNVMNISLIL